MDQHAKLEIVAETVLATWNGSPLWKLPIPALVLIGEYTTNEGPYKDNYFIEFVSVEDGEAFFSRVSCYAEGLEQAFSGLEKTLGQPLLLELYASTDWNSRVVWPPALSGKPFLSPTQATSTFKAVMQRLGIRGPDQLVSAEVKAYIAEQVSKHASSRGRE